MRTKLTVKTKLAVAVLVGGLLVAGCSTQSEAPEKPAAASSQNGATDAKQKTEALLDEQGLKDVSGQELITKLDELAVAERPNNLFASIRADHVLVSDMQGDGEISVPTPQDEFYVSFAPYVSQTHECFYHSLTTCKGELSDAPIHVKITNKATGETLVDEATRTYDNGFIGFWLPRDIEATVTFEHEDHSVTADIATGPEDATCVTTMQMA